MDKAESYRYRYRYVFVYVVHTSVLRKYYTPNSKPIRGLGYLTIIETQYVLALVDRCNVVYGVVLVF